MRIVAVMHVRDALESLGQAGAHLGLADETVASWARAPRHIEDALVCEVAHDVIEIMAIERIEERLQQLDGHALRPAIHRMSSVKRTAATAAVTRSRPASPWFTPSKNSADR